MLQHIQQLLNYTMNQSFKSKIRVNRGGACRTVENNKLFLPYSKEIHQKTQMININSDLVISHKFSCHYLFQIEELIRFKKK